MNYNTLRNKPTINYRELIGDSTVSEVGGMTEEEFDQLLDTDLASYYTKAQIDELFARSFIEKEKSGSIVTFDCPSSKNGISEVISEIVAVQSGTGDPSPTNIRPITGWSAVNRYRTGVNLWKYGNVTGTRYVAIQNPDLPIGNYTISTEITSTDTDGTISTIYIVFEDNTSTTIRLARNERVSSAVNIHHKITEIDFYAGRNYSESNNDDFTFANIQFEIGDRATTYEAFSGTTYTTALKDSQGNPMECYGGELLNENGVQSLENGRKKVKISDLTWNYNSTYGYFNATISDMTSQYTGASEITKTLCSIYKYKGADVSWANMGDLTFGINEQSFRIKDARYSTPEDFVQSVGNQEILYELATPQTIPQDNLAIASSAGINNIWCDSGDITVKALDRIIQG